MRRFVLAVVLLLLVFTVCVAENIYLSRTLDSVTAEIDRLSEAFYGGDPTADRTDSLNRLWEKNEGRMELFLDHSTVDEITTEIKKLQFLNDFDRYDFAETVNTLKSLIEDIRSSENISIDGLF